MFGRRVFGVGILGLLVLTAGLAQAQTTPQTIYVDATNGEGQDGSIAAPFRTIAAAIGLVTPNRGDTILVGGRCRRDEHLHRRHAQRPRRPRHP